MSHRMKINFKWLPIMAVLISLLCGHTVFAQPQGEQSKQPLRILYIGGDTDVFGGPGPERANDFRQFLERYFTSVKSCKGSEFKPEMARDVDVIVKDAPIPIVLPATFRKPMVLVGSNGFNGIDRTGTKIDLLCECLKEKLHTFRTDHAIFRGPLPVTPTVADEVDPVTGKTVGMWKVHEKMEDPGLVTSIEQFLDADDSEIISGGVNLKGDHGVGLVREANLFLWGPIGAPRVMTDEARRVFVNTIVYMKQFDGAQQMVWRGRTGRKSLEQVLATKDLKRMLSPERAFNNFTPDIVKRFGPDIEKYRAYYNPNMGYLRQPHGAVWFEIDEDAKSIGVPNNDVRFLERCIELLRNPSETAKALRLLRRYTGQSFADADAWQEWLKQSRNKLYFSDSYDYRFFGGPAGPAPTANNVRTAIEALNLSDPSDVAPVSAGAAAASYFYAKDGTYSKKGALMTLVVRLNIADGWHTYARVPQDVPYKLTKIDADLPTGFRWDGEWQTPLTNNGDLPGVTEYRGDVMFTRQFYSTLAVAKAKLRGVIRFQTCDVQRCMPAENAPFEIPITVYEH